MSSFKTLPVQQNPKAIDIGFTKTKVGFYISFKSKGHTGLVSSVIIIVTHHVIL